MAQRKSLKYISENPEFCSNLFSNGTEENSTASATTIAPPPLTPHHHYQDVASSNTKSTTASSLNYIYMCLSISMGTKSSCNKLYWFTAWQAERNTEVRETRRERERVDLSKKWENELPCMHWVMLFLYMVCSLYFKIGLYLSTPLYIYWVIGSWSLTYVNKIK